MFAYVPIKGMQYCVQTFCNWFGTWKTTAKLWLLPCDCCRKVTVQALNPLKCCKTNQHRRIKGATSMKSYPPQSLLQILYQKLLENNDQNQSIIFSLWSGLHFGFFPNGAYRADRPAIRQAEASVFPSFFQPAEKLIIIWFEFSLPGT